MKEITLNVCQGVGDIFWVYQKFAPYVDKINFRITHVHNSNKDISNRAIDFLKLLPKTGKIDYWLTSSEEYQWIADNYHPIDRILEKLNLGFNGPFDHACNHPLEEGIRIEDIDKNYPIETNTEINITSCLLDFNPKEYICLYVSGSTKHPEVIKNVGIWTNEQWVEFIIKFYNRFKLNNPIAIIGADYDKETTLIIEKLLSKNGFNIKSYINYPASNVLYIIKNSLCFIGYQSGLNILADNMDVKQIMLYFPMLKKMLYTWCKQENWDKNIFNAATFDEPIDSIVKNLKLKFTNKEKKCTNQNRKIKFKFKVNISVNNIMYKKNNIYTLSVKEAHGHFKKGFGIIVNE